VAEIQRTKNHSVALLCSSSQNEETKLWQLEHYEAYFNIEEIPFHIRGTEKQL